jgi:hypothetical protein
VVLIIVALVVALGLGIALSLYQLAQTEPLMRQADALPAGDARVARQREVLQFQADNLTKIWTTIVQAVVGVVLAVGAVATWRNLQVAQEGQLTTRFTQAIDQLGAETDGKPNLEVRLGGIYALERIARDSPRDHWTIMQILTAYVRQNARWTTQFPPDGAVSSPEDAPREQPWEGEEPPRLRTDIQAILKVIRNRRPKRPEPAGVDLRGTDLCREFLRGAPLEGAYLMGTHLEGANLRGAHLLRANLRDAHLKGADLAGAHLAGANLRGAHLEGAQLAGADLQWPLRGRDGRLSLTQEQVYSALHHGEGALLPPDWPDDWRDHFDKSTPPPPATPSAA